MKTSRNKKNKSNKSKSNTNSQEDIDKKKDSADDKNIDLDKINQDDDISDDDSSIDSDMSDEINKKIDLICDRNKSNLVENEIKNDDDYQFDKKKNVKYEKKEMKNDFGDYFDAFKRDTDIDGYYEVNYPKLKYDLKIDVYSDLFKLISKGKIFPTLLNKDFLTEEKFKENNNVINTGNLFKLIYDLFLQEYNIFIYGFGSKMRLSYDFIEYYREHYYEENDIPLYVISCNLNNSEMSFKIILNKIQQCLEIEFEKNFCGGKFGDFSNEATIEGNITKVQQIYNQIKYKINKKKEIKINDKKSNDSESESKNEENYVSSSDDENKGELPNNKNNNNSSYNEEKLPFIILLVLNNIGSTIGLSKTFQQNLSDLALHLYFIKLFATCENLVIPHYWTLEVKDKFKFCYLKYDTYEPYDSEIDENNSIKIGNNIKGGYGLKEIFCSFSDTQKRLMKEIAKLNLKGDHDHLTPKGLINHFTETGIGIATDIHKLEELIAEAIDHEIVELKVSGENNKEIYKMNLERNIIEKIAEGEFM
jgi:hypothetical protein